MTVVVTVEMVVEVFIGDSGGGDSGDGGFVRRKRKWEYEEKKCICPSCFTSDHETQHLNVWKCPVNVEHFPVSCTVGVTAWLANFLNPWVLCSWEH